METVTDFKLLFLRPRYICNTNKEINWKYTSIISHPSKILSINYRYECAPWLGAYFRYSFGELKKIFL